MKRLSWDDYFQTIAETVSRRATCPRAQVGAVIVKNNRILSTGYNGAASGEPHCLEAGCILENGRYCQRAIHAETNAVAQAAKMGIAIDGATLYYYDSRNRSPLECVKCYQVMRAAGIAIVASKGHRHIMRP